MIALGAFLGTVLVYQFRPAESDNWTPSALLNKYRSKAEDWEAVNTLHTKAMEQAGYDRNLFENGSNKHRFVDVAYPEYVLLFYIRERGISLLANQIRNTELSNPTPRETSRPATSPTLTMLWNTTDSST